MSKKLDSEIIEELTNQLDRSMKAHAAVLEEVRCLERVLKVLVAAGHLDQDKLQQAKDLVGM